jgi:hypothetical protein
MIQNGRKKTGGVLVNAPLDACVGLHYVNRVTLFATKKQQSLKKLCTMCAYYGVPTSGNEQETREFFFCFFLFFCRCLSEVSILLCYGCASVGIRVPTF